MENYLLSVGSNYFWPCMAKEYPGLLKCFKERALCLYLQSDPDPIDITTAYIIANDVNRDTFHELLLSTSTPSNIIANYNQYTRQGNRF